MLKKFFFILTITTFFFLGSKNALAQGCPVVGFETSGCFTCWYNDSIGACGFGGNPSGDNFCNPGFGVTVSVCDNVGTDNFQCNAKVTACITNAETKYYCKDGLSCSECDNDPSTTTPDCPSSETIYSGIGPCLPHCPITQLNACEQPSIGGTCREACSSTEQEVFGIANCTGLTPRCCKPANAGPVATTIGGIPVNLPCNPALNPDCDPTCPASDGTRGINTAAGCISVTTNGTIIFFLRLALAIGGGIAILLIIYAGIQIQTSSGDPKRLMAGKEILTSALVGLILLIFSVFILRIIGLNLLGIF